MTIVSASDVTEPFAGAVPYPSFGRSAAALHGFRMTYTDLRDREIALLQVLVGGQGADLSPAAQAPPLVFPDGDLHVALQDRNPSGEDFAYEVSHNLLNIPGSRRFQIRDVGCVGSCVRPLPRRVFGTGRFGFQTEPYLLALVGFKLYFTGARDRDVKAIGVWLEGSNLHVELRDRTATETFGYVVDFVAIPTSLLNSGTTVVEGGGTANDSAEFQLPNRGQPMLSGWRLEFQGDVDEELLDIGARISGNRVNVFFGDQGGGEPFDWKVWVSHVAPQVVF